MAGWGGLLSQLRPSERGRQIQSESPTEGKILWECVGRRGVDPVHLGLEMWSPEDVVFQQRADEWGVGGSPCEEERTGEGQEPQGVERRRPESPAGAGPGTALLAQVKIRNFIFSYSLCHLSLKSAQKEEVQLPISQTENRGLE